MRTHFNDSERPAIFDRADTLDMRRTLRRWARYESGAIPNVEASTRSPFGWRQDGSRNELLRLSADSNNPWTLLNAVGALGSGEYVAYVDPDDDRTVRVGYARGGSTSRGTRLQVRKPRGGTVEAHWWVLANAAAGQQYERVAGSTSASDILSMDGPEAETPKEREYQRADFEAGALVLLTDVPSRPDLNGKIAKITSVMSDRFHFMEGTSERYCYKSGAHVVRRANGQYIPGTPVLVTEALAGASARFKSEAQGRATNIVTQPGYSVDRTAPYVHGWPSLRAQFTDSFRSSEAWRVTSLEFLTEHVGEGTIPDESRIAPYVNTSERLFPQVAKPTAEADLTAEQWKAKWDALWEALGQQANDRDWCSEYDAFARANGGPERPVEYDIQVVAEIEWSASEADTHLGRVIVPSGYSIDVQESVTIKHRFWLNDVKGFQAVDLEGPSASVYDRLLSIAKVKGYQADAIVEVQSYNES